MRTREQRGYQMFPVLDGARVETALPQAARWLPCRSSRDRVLTGFLVVPTATVLAVFRWGGMGPVDRLHTTAGKWLAGGYALFAGLVFIVLAGVMLGPVIHAVLHRFHLEVGGQLPQSQ